MTDPPQSSHGHASRFEHEGHLRALDDFEVMLVKQSVVPDVRKLLVRRFSSVFHVLTAIVLGGLVAMGTVFVNFIIFTKVLHL